MLTIDLIECNKCHIPKPASEYHKKGDRIRKICKLCRKPERHKRYLSTIERTKQQNQHWTSNNRARVNIRSKESRILRRRKCLEYYGGKCTCCGEPTYEFLAIDHINGGGGKHIRQLGGGGTYIYSYLIRNNFPEGYRVLCHNCNCAIGAYGYCPHQTHEKEKSAQLRPFYASLRRKRQRRLFVIERYGGECACCGENKVEFLTIDHPNRDGAAHRRIIGGSGSRFYLWLQRNNYPDGFRVLCWNCNFADGLYGGCPHVVTH